MKTVRFLLCFLLMLIYVQNESFAQSQRWDEKDFAYLSNRIGMRMFAELADKEKGSILLSPYALTSSLLQIYLSGSEEQQKNLKETFGFNTEDDVLLKSYKKAGRFFELSMTNPVFFQRQTTLPDDFSSLSRREFNESPQFTDFNYQRNAQSAINRFVNKKINTFGEDLFPRKGNLFEVINAPLIISAASSQTEWGTFYASSRERFGNRRENDGKRRPSINMITGRGNFGFRNFNGFVVIITEHDHIQSVIVLPDKNVSLSSVLNKINPDNIDSICSRFFFYYGEITIPEFKLNFRTSMKNTINALGGKTLFKKNENDSNPLAFSDFIVFYMSEYYMSPSKGESPLPSPKLEFSVSVDRPFLYFTRETKTGTLLFLGRFQPTESD